MNVVTANKNKEVIDKLDFDIIKRVDGEFEVSELLSNFVNLYFNKMVIDITSIKNYQNIEEIKKLSTQVEANRVIFVISDDINNNSYLAELVKLGFYNFTRNFEGVKFLYANPNGYDNVKYLLDAPAEPIASANPVSEQANQVDNVPEIKFVPNGTDNGGIDTNGKKVIGIVNLTTHAGATTLVNMMVRQLNANGYKAKGLEMFRQDLLYYHDDNLQSCMNVIDLESALKKDANVFVIDINDFGGADKYCDDILYLIEPSQIKITKLLKKNGNAFIERKNDKVVLNMSLVNDQEIPDFEYESKVKIFDNIPPINDRDTNSEEINELLRKLGFNVQM